MQCNCPVTRAGPTLASACGGGQFMLFMGLLEVFIRSQCDLEDPCGRPQSHPEPLTDYDFIVVGLGSAGSVLASRLSENPHWKVLGIEAGGNEPTGTQVPSMFINFLGSDIDWKYKTEPQDMACLNEPERRCSWPRGKVLGGTSVLNGMMYMRGSRRDYDNWAAMGNTGWSYRDVFPYFLKSEDNQQVSQMDEGEHGVGGPLTITQFPYVPPMGHAIIEGARELGAAIRDVNGYRHTGFTIAQTTSRNGSRLSASKAFLRPVKNRANLHILLNTTVARVLVDEKRKEAYGVEVIRSDGTRQQYRAKLEVIVSAGAVASPQLLLLSGIGPRDEIQQVGVRPVHNLSGVGRNLHNHVAFFINFSVNDTNTNPMNWATAMEYLLFRDGLMSGTGLSSVTGFTNSRFSNPADDHPDIQFFFSGYLAACAMTGQVGEKADGDPTSTAKRTVTIFPAVLHPKSRGYLRLASSNPLDHPRIFANYLSHPDDVTMLTDGIRFAIRLTETQAMQRYGVQLDKTPIPGCESMPFGCDAYWECAVRRQTMPENHQAGSCAMGTDPQAGAVVNPELKVHGIDRLRVVDASVIPVVTSGNTHAPVVMIAEKASDMIKQRWLQRHPNTVFYKK